MTFISQIWYWLIWKIVTDRRHFSIFKCSLGIEDREKGWLGKKAPEKVAEDGIQSMDGGICFRQKERQLLVTGWKVERLRYIGLWQQEVSSFPCAGWNTTLSEERAGGVGAWTRFKKVIEEIVE